MKRSSVAEAQRVSPDRMQYGAWCEQRNRMLGEGDVIASYSGDLIPQGRIRKPFFLQGLPYVTVSMGSGPQQYAEAYRLEESASFAGAPMTYDQRAQDAEAARSDSHGFYHGVTVKHRNAQCVLSGPPIVLIADDLRPKLQLEFF
jgi:hypothetical protein